jgi:hypothetical protein
VHFLYAGEQHGPEKKMMQAYYEAELEESGPANFTFSFVEYAGEVQVTHAISDYVNDANPNVFAIAPRATRDRSSITDYIVNHVFTSVLLCKA